MISVIKKNGVMVRIGTNTAVETEVSEIVSLEKSSHKRMHTWLTISGSGASF